LGVPGRSDDGGRDELPDCCPTRVSRSRTRSCSCVIVARSSSMVACCPAFVARCSAIVARSSTTSALQGGDHGWHHSPERATKPTRHPTPVNGYGGHRRDGGGRAPCPWGRGESGGEPRVLDAVPAEHGRSRALGRTPGHERRAPGVAGRDRADDARCGWPSCNRMRWRRARSGRSSRTRTGSVSRDWGHSWTTPAR